MTIGATLCIIQNDGQILLQLKTSGRFGEGKWNGTGGKIDLGETPLQAAIREVKEETSLDVSDLRLHGVLNHYFGPKDINPWQVHIYSTNAYKGTPTASEEGELRWFTPEEIPYGQMWQDDKHWLPLLLEGREFTGEFHFNEDGSDLQWFRLTVK
jgi:mutator protein MutT